MDTICYTLHFSIIDKYPSKTTMLMFNAWVKHMHVLNCLGSIV